MKIRYFLVLLFLGVSLSASANDGGDHDGPSSHDVIHDVITGWHGDKWDFFGNDDDKGKYLGWGNLSDLLGDMKDHWRWGKSPYCDWPPVVSSVPEPEAWAMMLAGVGMMSWLTRRRKQQAGR